MSYPDQYDIAFYMYVRDPRDFGPLEPSLDLAPLSFTDLLRPIGVGILFESRRSLAKQSRDIT